MKITYMVSHKSYKGKEEELIPAIQDLPFHPVVQAHWMKPSKFCEFDKASNLTESQYPLPAFENIEWEDRKP